MSDALTIDDLHGAPYNPRLISDAAAGGLSASMEDFGDISGIIFNRRTGNLVCGHQRVERLRALGGVMKRNLIFVGKGLDKLQFPVRVVDWDQAKEKRANIAANNPHIAGIFDDNLEALLREIQSDGAEEFERLRLNELMVEVKLPVDPPTPPVPEPPKNPITKPGDVWHLGRHRVICGDCRKPGDVAAVLDGQRINVAFTSPPYASQRKYDESSGFKPIKPDDYVEWFAAVQENVREHLADDGSWFVNIKAHCEGGQRHLYVMYLVLAHVREWGWRFVDDLCWVRGGVPGRWHNRFKNGWEPVFHFGVQGDIKMRHEAVSYPSDSVPVKSSQIGASSGGPNGAYWNLSEQIADGLALPSNVVTCSGVSPGMSHTAAFPVGLPAFFVKAYSDEGDNIFDPFIGSGTTLIAAEQLDRTCYGVEISPAYCDVIVQRWEALTGEEATRG